ncbi:hypothetical protein [Microlunatus parietis]|uniref:PH domain-containing protein n=1 Tax=Microlunatus parietis TaxID=682979 RepID=A0A7Y9LA30_9ACTN|nr:hypothetical protein [Microlunatus parietis]NYE69225.1 hypothetical protein [Microlunatus parietis]
MSDQRIDVLRVERRHWTWLIALLLVGGVAIGALGFLVQPGVSPFTLIGMILSVASLTLYIGEAKPTPVITAGPGGIAQGRQALIPWERVRTVLIKEFAEPDGPATTLILLSTPVAGDDPIRTAASDGTDPRMTGQFRLPDVISDFPVERLANPLRRFRPDLDVIDLRP